MSVSERLRAALPGSDDSADDAGGSMGSGWVRGAVVGLLTGLTSLVVVLALGRANVAAHLQDRSRGLDAG